MKMNYHQSFENNNSFTFLFINDICLVNGLVVNIENRILMSVFLKREQNKSESVSDMPRNFMEIQ